jgi:ubiquinone/menaquinone biosynthesis C-methylase UbiE
VRKEILQYYGERNATYLHGSGENATEFLLDELQLNNKNEQVLEFGFGTGGTLVKVKSRYAAIQLYGVDVSPLMLKKASKRLKFCGLQAGVSLVLSPSDNSLPFANHQFDKVYAESVLGIQDAVSLRKILSEIFRVLRPGGCLVLNESVWAAHMKAEEIEDMNRRCKQAFGIIQASSEYAGTAQWLELLQQTGFSVAQFKKITPTQNKKTKTFAEILSVLFTFGGKINSLRPALLKERLAYQTSMKEISPANGNYLEVAMFFAVK